MTKEIKVLTQNDVVIAANEIARWAKTYWCHGDVHTLTIFGVPRGGVPAAYLVADQARGLFPEVRVLDTPDKAMLIIDDIVDSGATRTRYTRAHPHAVFRALFEPSPMAEVSKQPWLVFPWEATAEGSADDIPRRLLQFIGEDADRAGLRDTPARFLRAWQEYTSGYRVQEAEFVQSLKVFEDGAQDVDEMVIVRDIPVYSMCEHHLAPFFGTAHVAYIPKGRVLGLSKIARVVDYYSRRLQVQERLTQQIAKLVAKAAGTADVGVVVRCRHMCMEQRGIKVRDSSTVTSSMWGVLRESASARAELLALVR